MGTHSSRRFSLRLVNEGGLEEMHLNTATTTKGNLISPYEQSCDGIPGAAPVPKNYGLSDFYILNFSWLICPRWIECAEG